MSFKMGNTWGRESTVQGISLLLYGMSGSWPEVDRQKDFATIKLSPNQINVGQKWFLDSLEGDPGEVRIEGVGDVFLPVVYKKYWPWAAGILLAGAALGVLAGRRF